MEDVKMFRPGTTVRHVTGGPVMAVTSSDEDNTQCEWFDTEIGDFKQRSFDTPALVEHKPTDRMTSTQVQK